MKFEVKQINFFNGCLQLPVPFAEISKIGELQKACNGGKTLSVEVKVKRHMRSTNANAYCWALCTEIAKAVHSSKEEVYQQAIRNIGAFTLVPIKAEAVERYTEIWKAHGLGWVIDDMGDSKLPGYKVLACYHGSSTYNTKEMSELIEFLIDEARNLGIDVISEADKALLMEDWRGSNDNKKSHEE